MLPITAAVLFAIGVHLLLTRGHLNLLLGSLVLSQGVNLLIFLVARPKPGHLPIIEDESMDVLSTTDPLSQALILTAIVIGFALTAFLVILIRRNAVEDDL